MEKQMDKRLYKYCTGCGLCSSIGAASIDKDKKGFIHPVKGNQVFLRKICPSYGVQSNIFDEKEIWGRAEKVFYGWSNDDAVREKGSSGGVITELCLYLLQEGHVDAVLHTCAEPDIPTKTMPCISVSYSDLISRAGSRYAISSPLSIISEIDRNKKYVFVGRPCDVDILRNYSLQEPHIAACIPYMLSFFCMGTPSDEAQEKLLDFLGCAKSDCFSLRYRGDGWPGLTKVVDRTGKEYTTDYDTSWGKILGRDLMNICRFCANGVGETADISAGDAWYLDEYNKPVFSEKQGRNVVFARNKKGLRILEDAKEKGYITLNDFCDYREKLPFVQYAQFERRATLNSRLMALKVLLKPYPRYNRTLLHAYKTNVSLKRRWDSFKGTIRRAYRI